MPERFSFPPLSRRAKADSATDGDLIAQIDAGNRAALEYLYARYRARGYRVAAAVCGDSPQAEDAVCNAFLSVWQGRARDRELPRCVSAWLLSIVRQHAIALARMSQHATPGLALLATLPDDQHEVVVLALYGGLSHHDLAAHFDLPSAAVKHRMRLGLHELGVRREAAERAAGHGADPGLEPSG